MVSTVYLILYLLVVLIIITYVLLCIILMMLPFMMRYWIIIEVMHILLSVVRANFVVLYVLSVKRILLINYLYIMHLSPHFKLFEFTSSYTARVNNIDNNPTFLEILNLARLCSLILEPLRLYLNCPIRINSGYRSIALNSIVGGVPNSNHTKGLACDFDVDTSAHYLMAYRFLENLNCVDELIKYPTFIHVSLKNNY